MNHIHQDPHAVRHTIPAGASVSFADELLDAGGYLRAAAGAKSIKLTRIASTGAPKGGGNYFVLLATKPVIDFVWDNTGVALEITNGDEAALRVMGGAGNVTLINVCFRCRKHDRGDDSGQKIGSHGVPQDFWKQVQQWRDVRKAIVRGGYTIGPIDSGQQKDTAQTPQHVDELIFDHHAMTVLTTVTDWKTVGSIQFIGCPKIDENRKQIGVWPDAIWTAANHR